jgi:argininosuccinate lyase
MRESCKSLVVTLHDLIQVSVERAERELDVIMPGYTHLQRAQPIRWSHWILCYAFSFQQDVIRLHQLMDRINLSPLGSGALAGNPFGIDRKSLAASMNFKDAIPNSLLGVSDRDFVAEFLFWASLTMTHLSRFSEDLIIYSSGEFGFIQLADAYSTGSSLMPQKKNPDSLELIRGKVGRVFGSMTGFMMTYKGLPLTYNKDLQEDKEGIFDAYDTLHGCLTICTRLLATLKINPDRMKASLSMDMLATDLAEYLVRKGVPFRETHHVAGHAVKLAEQKSCSLSELTLDDFKSLHSAFDADVEAVWDYEKSVEMRDSYGGTSRASVTHQIQELKLWLNQ